jgi:hypothetical protein
MGGVAREYITKLGCEKYFRRVIYWALLEMLLEDWCRKLIYTNLHRVCGIGLCLGMKNKGAYMVNQVIRMGVLNCFEELPSVNKQELKCWYRPKFVVLGVKESAPKKVVWGWAEF